MLFGFVGKYSPQNMARVYRDNKPAVDAYLAGKPIEAYDSDDDKAGGIAVVLLMLFLGTIGLVIWIWALVVLLKYWNQLPQWAQVVGVLAQLGVLGGPIVTLLVVYIAKGKGGSSFGKY